jgi:C-terminal processing protease CtpA/Prc
MNSRSRIAFVAAVVLAVAFMSLPVFAGGKEHKCSMDAQSCLNKMAASMKTRGWLGIEMDDSKGALAVARVIPGSPAEAAGFRTGDRLVSVEGLKFADNTDDKCVTCEGTKSIWLPGRQVHYVVERAGSEVRIDPTLAAMPSDVMAQWIGKHMLEHAQIEVAQK